LFAAFTTPRRDVRAVAITTEGRMRIALIAVWVGLALMLAGCAGSAPEVKGEVVSVDTDRKLVTLNHEAIPNVSMPAMIMMFAVKDPSALAALKAGERVRFTADFVDGTLTVTSIRQDQSR